MKEKIEESRKELKELKLELIECSQSIKDCQDSEQCKKLFEEKNEIQNDIAEIEAEIENMLELEKAQQEEGKTEE